MCLNTGKRGDIATERINDPALLCSDIDEKIKRIVIIEVDMKFCVPCKRIEAIVSSIKMRWPLMFTKKATTIEGIPGGRASTGLKKALVVELRNKILKSPL